MTCRESLIQVLFCQAGPSARGRTAQPLADAAQPLAPLSDMQMGAVRAAAREMVTARSWSGSATVAALQARLAMNGLHLGEASLIKASGVIVSPPVDIVIENLLTTAAWA